MCPDKATSTYKLIASYKENILIGRAQGSFPKWSDRFLLFCEQTADRTLKFVESLPEKHSSGAISGEDYSSLLSAIMQSWELLHTFIKPVLDADTLKVPYPFIDFIVHHIGRLHIVEGAKFVIETSSGLDYFQRAHTRLKEPLLVLRLLLDGPELDFPLGFLGLPCSQNKSLFMNCLLYHEVGHYIAEEAGILSVEDYENLTKELGRQFAEFSRWATTILVRWMQELFADLVAARLAGLAYTLAYAQLLRHVSDLPEGEQAWRFSGTHPADVLRLNQQLVVLRDDGWADYYPDSQEWRKLCQMVEDPEVSRYLPPSEDTIDPQIADMFRTLIRALHDRKDFLQRRVSTLLSDRRNPQEIYGQYKDKVRESLEHGIVPSRMEGSDSPHPISVINGAILFWYSGMDSLYSRVPRLGRHNPKDRAFLEGRLEMWCLKGIEDWLITNH